LRLSIELKLSSICISDLGFVEGTVEENIRYIYKLANHCNKVYNRKQILAYLAGDLN